MKSHLTKLIIEIISTYFHSQFPVLNTSSGEYLG